MTARDLTPHRERPRTPKQRVELAEEVRWLRSFGKTWPDIAVALHISVPYARKLAADPTVEP